VNRYREALHHQLGYHNILERSKSLLEVANENKWSPDHLLRYERLDQIITESMLYAEATCSRKITKPYEWSPKLIHAVETTRFWQLLLKRSRGIPVQPSTIYLARSNVDLSPATDSYDQPTIINNLRTAIQTMRDLQKSHVELRESYLHGLAEALVLEKRPYLKEEGNTSTLHILMNERLQSLIRREKNAECTIRLVKSSWTPLPWAV
jgi:hypothetical protein